MKKILTCVMALLAAVCLYATDLNVYASGLNATTTTNVISATTIDYVLNAPATALNVKLYDGSTLVATVPITGAANLTKGSHASVPVDLSNVANGTYTWALEAIGEAHNDDQEVKISAVPISNADSRGMTFDDDPESPYFGTMYIANSNAVNTISAATAELTDTVIIVNNTTYWTATKSSPMRLTIGDDGLLYASDWSDNTPNITIIDRSNNSTRVVFGGTTTGSGIYKNAQDEYIHGSMVSCCVVGTGSERVLYTVDEDIAVNGKTNCIFKYNIGELASLWTDTYEVAYDNADGLLANGNHHICSDGHGGLWISQHRWSDDANPALCHVNAAGVKDWYSTGEITSGGYANTRAALFVNHDKSLVFTSANNCVKVWHPVFIGNDLDTLELVQTIATDVTENYNVIVDPARNAYLLGTKCMWAYAAAGDNVCEIPARVANTITVTNIEQLYEIGNNQPSGFVPTEGTAMRKVEGNVFVYEGSLPADTYFAFSTVLAANNDDGGWAYLNSHRYGATTNNLDIAYGESEDLVAGTNTFKMSAAGFYTITVNFNTMKVSVASLPAKVEIMQGWDNWAPVLMTNDDGVTCTATIALEPGDYSGNENGFKVRINDNTIWYGVFDIFKRKMGAANRTKVLNSASDNAGLWADVPGDYIFTYKYATGEMTVTWPESFTRTAEIGDYQTLCVPFTAYVTGAEVYEIKASDIHSGYVTLTAAAAELHAGYSYILKATATTINIYMPGGTVQYEPIQPGGGATGLYGALSVSYLYKYDTETSWRSNYVLQSDNKFHEVQEHGEVTINSTRAYLHIAGGANAPELRIIEAGNEATNIENVEANEQAVKFIQNGQMFIKKNGVVYDMMGHIVR